MLANAGRKEAAEEPLSVGRVEKIRKENDAAAFAAAPQAETLLGRRCIEMRQARIVAP